ncbi:MAG: HlyD family type I secretion periplasmic adaptor subunit [Betaproteobacteria bacterium]|nr:HlyD family type I secretion periplasmic adaptor subunit [Betaproteobacteria bacterium]
MKLQWQAAQYLLSRYAAILRHVWSERKSFDAPPRLAHEAQFLPAALELQETPVSPAPRIAMWLLMSFALIALLWAVFGHVDLVATAQGKIVPNEGTKVIQPMEIATVHAILVSDGQHVKAGDVLIELDATSTTADSNRLADEFITAKLQAARAEALLTAMSSPTGKLPVIKPLVQVSKERLAREQRVLAGQYAEFQAQSERVEAEIAKREAELRSTQEIVRKLEQTVPIVRQRAQDYTDLLEKNFISRHGYLEKEQARIEMEADLATQRSRLKELDAALREGRNQKTALVAQTRRQALDSLNEASQKAASFDQEIIKAHTRGMLMTLTAPVDGTVQQLAVHTIGGVVTPAQPLLMIVPRDHPLEIEAFIENKDIGFVNVGQVAEVKIETFPFTKYGTIPAHVTHVSHDAINDEKRGLVYSARIKLERATIQVDGKTVSLSPGMAASVEIKTGTRQVIEYFLSPLLQYQNESLRER